VLGPEVLTAISSAVRAEFSRYLDRPAYQADGGSAAERSALGVLRADVASRSILR
jgi:hypothetical protein